MEHRSLQLPRVEDLLHVPVSVVVEFVSNRSEAEILLGIGELAHEFDHVTSYLVQWVEHQQYLRGDCQIAAGTRGSQISSLAPLTCQARVANRHGVKVLQQRVTECLQKLQRHMEAVQVFANQNASFAQELRLCGLGARADQRRRLAETESALANRLSKFLSGCDSFYDEPPLSVAMKCVSAASKDQREPMAADKRARTATDVERPGDTDDSSSTVSAPRAERVAGRKRPAPTGGLGGSRIFDDAGGGAAVAEVTAEGKGNKDNPGIARPDDVDEGKTCGGHGGSGPAKHERLLEEVAAGGQKCGKRSAVDEPNAEENSQHHVDEGGNDDGFMAPSFLTPPLLVVTAGGSGGGGGGADVLRGVAPPSACSSAGSTPSNGSFSPALAVASPVPNASQRCGGGRAGGAGVFVADRRRYAAHAAALSEDRPSLSSSPTPPSTREPSPPPLSTQEQSLSPGENGEETGDDVANHDGRNKARKGRGTEEGGRWAEDEGRAFGRSGGHGYKNAADARETAGTLAVSKGVSSFSGSVMRASRGAGGGGQAAGAVGDADDACSRAEEEDDSEQAQERVGDTEEEEEEEEEDVDMHDTADTIEESVGGAAPVASAEAAVAERQMGEVGNANNSKSRRAADDSKQTRDEYQESGEVVAAEPYSGSQGGAGADEAGGAETETETGGNQLVGGRVAHSV